MVLLVFVRPGFDLSVGTLRSTWNYPCLFSLQDSSRDSVSLCCLQGGALDTFASKHIRGACVACAKSS